MFFVLSFCELSTYSPAGIAAQESTGPAAAASALILLGRRDYPNLIPRAANAAEAQKKLTQILASDLYMANGMDVGTETAFPLQGIERYVRRCAYHLVNLKYQGIRLCPAGYSAGFTPRLDWMIRGLRSKAGECLLIGRYEYDSQKDLYTRSGGSWLNVISWQRNPYKQGCSVLLLVYNPLTGKQDWLYLDPLKHSKLQRVDSHGRSMGLSDNAAGLYQATYGRGTGIIEGVVVFNF